MRLPLPCLARRGVLVALLLPLALAGCSGTRLGEALSRSFSGAPTAPGGASQAPTAGVPGPGEAAGSTAGLTSAAATSRSGAAAVSPPAKVPTAGRAPTGDQASGAARTTAAGLSQAPLAATPTTGATAPAAAPGPRRPAPYRVTILLPQADASAPAEVVTQALRAAGVPFEVETIERIGSGSGSSPSAPGPAAPQAAPTVRPAPAPR